MKGGTGWQEDPESSPGPGMWGSIHPLNQIPPEYMNHKLGFKIMEREFFLPSGKGLRSIILPKKVIHDKNC